MTVPDVTANAPLWAARWTGFGSRFLVGSITGTAAGTPVDRGAAGAGLRAHATLSRRAPRGTNRRANLIEPENSRPHEPDPARSRLSRLWPCLSSDSHGSPGG